MPNCELSDPWMLLDEAIDHVIIARKGDGARSWLHHPWILVSPETKYEKLAHIIINIKPYEEALAELRWALADGQITAYEEVARPGSADPLHRPIQPVAWSTLRVKPTVNPSSEVPRRIRVKRAAVEKLWPLQTEQAAPMPSGSRSPFLKSQAHEIFVRTGGWPELSQKAAARELRVAYEKELVRSPLPSQGACVDWIREWRLKQTT